MKTKNFGPCSIINCVDTNVRFRVITELAYEKCLKNQTLQLYPQIAVYILFSR
jgi:hypothetical protein